MIATKDGTSLLVEVKGDPPGHVSSPGTINVDVYTLLGQIVMAKGQGLADEYAVAMRPVHMRLLTKAFPALRLLGVSVMLVADHGVRVVVM